MTYSARAPFCPAAITLYSVNMARNNGKTGLILPTDKVPAYSAGHLQWEHRREGGVRWAWGMVGVALVGGAPCA